MGRGLSPLQRDIVEIARTRGYVSVAEATEAAVNYDSKAGFPFFYASASRALRRLVKRGLLQKERRLRWRRGHRSGVTARIYRAKGFIGPSPVVYIRDWRHEVPDPEKVQSLLREMLLAQASALGANG